MKACGLGSDSHEVSNLGSGYFPVLANDTGHQPVVQFLRCSGDILSRHPGSRTYAAPALPKPFRWCPGARKHQANLCVASTSGTSPQSFLRELLIQYHVAARRPREPVLRRRGSSNPRKKWPRSSDSSPSVCDSGKVKILDGSKMRSPELGNIATSPRMGQRLAPGTATLFISTRGNGSESKNAAGRLFGARARAPHTGPQGRAKLFRIQDLLGVEEKISPVGQKNKYFSAFPGLGLICCYPGLNIFCFENLPRLQIYSAFTIVSHDFLSAGRSNQQTQSFTFRSSWYHKRGREGKKKNIPLNFSGA